MNWFLNLFKKEKERLTMDYFAKKYVHVSEYEIKDWLKQSSTKEFLRIVNELRKLEDHQVHKGLAENKLEEASLSNAGLVQLKEVLGIPTIMIENAKEEKD